MATDGLPSNQCESLGDQRDLLGGGYEYVLGMRYDMQCALVHIYYIYILYLYAHIVRVYVEGI